MAGGYGRGPRHRPVQTLLDTREQPLFLGGNRVVVLVRSHELADYSEGTRETSAQQRHGRSLHTCYANLGEDPGAKYVVWPVQAGGWVADLLAVQNRHRAPPFLMAKVG